MARSVSLTAWQARLDSVWAVCLLVAAAVWTPRRPAPASLLSAQTFLFCRGFFSPIFLVLVHACGQVFGSFFPVAPYSVSRSPHLV